MPHYPLDYRIKDFLKRQILWSQSVLEELEAFTAAPDDSDFEILLEQQRRRERETQAMAKEYGGLSREWAAAEDIAPEAKTEIKRLSAEAEELVERVREGYGRAAAASEVMRAANRNARNDLRRRRRSVNIYRPGALVSPGFIDRKA